MGYKKQVIVLEDDPIYSMILTDQIRQFDVELNLYTTIPAFLNASHEVDIIFLDYHLEQNKTSEEIVDFLIANNCKAKIVMLSGQQDGNTVLKLIQKGVRDYIIKGNDTFDEIRTVMDECGVAVRSNSLSA